MTDYHPYIAILESNMKHFINKEKNQPEFLSHMIQYHMGWVDQEFQDASGSSGKRLRPLLLLLCCEALCGKWDHAVPAAMAVELLHSFTLIHDDIEDRDEMRRGRFTVWKVWGVPQAINAGDALYALAFKALLALSTERVTCTDMLTISQVYTDAVLRITEGQCLDIGFESRNIVSEEAYLMMISGKTASLFGLCCELGAKIAGAGLEIQHNMKEFGVALGMAFQMQDDILGLWGDPHSTGKPVGSDLVKGKKTLPIIHCGQHNAEFNRLSAKSISHSTLDHAMLMLEETGSYDYTQAKATFYLDSALHALDKVLAESHQAKIRPLIISLMQRQR